MADDWEELFARAEGKVETEPEAKRPKLQDPFQEYLAERWQSKKKWPVWLKLKGSLPNDDGTCQGFKESSSSPFCKRCRRPKSQHQAETSQNDPWHVTLFGLLRNIRCTAKLAATKRATSTDVVPYKFKALKNLIRKHLQAEIFSKLRESCRTLCSSQPIADGNTKKQAIQLIIACDAAYYDLYYLQIAQHLGQPYLPHPLDYFDTILQLDKQQPTSREQTPDNSRAQAWFGRPEQPGGTEHPLAALHSYRLIETRQLFSELIESKGLDAWIDDCGKEEEHATAAPPLLKDWRDSCRDYLCHFYAYATIPNSTIKAVADVLRRQSNSIQCVVEMGAGTGYVAKQLEQHGVSVEAYDVAPTDQADANEYHGATPPFYKVHPGDSVPRQDIKNKALLLCYPPPKSSMALKAVRKYVSLGGTCLVHVGEFQGLTGSIAFERYLLDKFVLATSGRFPCLTWGTDAAEVTIWRKRAHGDEARSILLPCSYCGTKEATRRCRLLRLLNYCSKSCFEKDKESRQECLGMSMIRASEEELDFDDARHFSTLDIEV